MKKYKCYGLAIRSKKNQNDFFVSDHNYRFISCDEIINKWHWAADPFLFVKDDQVYVFFEWYSQITRKGSIAYSVIRNGKLSSPRVVIQSQGHFSFPFIFEKSGNVYIIPETCDKKNIQIYQAVDFPNEWRMEKVLLDDIFTCDSIRLEDHNQSYILTSIMFDPQKEGTVQSCYVENQLYYVSDEHLEIRLINGHCGLGDDGIRNAGALFQHDGTWIRPGQDCTDLTYGHGVVFWKVEDINPYSEEKWLSVSSEEIKKHVVSDEVEADKIIGFHTYNTVYSYEIIDYSYCADSSLLVEIIHKFYVIYKWMRGHLKWLSQKR